jgi:hypothetical protein
MTSLGSGGRQADDNVEYEFKSVQALRGRESSAQAKWQDQGWEFVSENPGKLRTELTFRRVKPKAFGTYLLSFVAAFRRVQPKTFGTYLPSPVAAFRRVQPKTRLVLVASGALILVAGITGSAVGTQSGSDTPNPSAAQATASTTPPAGATGTDIPADEASESDAEQVLTAENNEEFAALLAVPDGCDETIAPFVADYAGRTIEFDGSIANIANHGDYDTRYDILVYPGDKGPGSTVGPALKFEDVNVSDLNLTGAKIPASVGEGDRFRFVAQFGEYNPDQCLLFLEPVSTRVR